jgi:hypothetical protein
MGLHLFGSLDFWIRIRIEIKSWTRIETNAVPQHWFLKYSSRAAEGVAEAGCRVCCSRTLRHMREAAALSTRLSHHARLRCIMHMTVAYAAIASCAMPRNHAPLGTAPTQSQFPHSCVCERFFIFPGLVHLFSGSRIGRPIMGI